MTTVQYFFFEKRYAKRVGLGRKEGIFGREMGEGEKGVGGLVSHSQEGSSRVRGSPPFFFYTLYVCRTSPRPEGDDGGGAAASCWDSSIQ